MNILLAVGSPRNKGNTYTLANEFKRQAEKAGHTCDLVSLNKKISPCQHCNSCCETRKCKIKDHLTPILESFDTYDAIVLASPMYFFHLTAQTKTFLDRLYSTDLVDKSLGAILVSGSEFFDGGCSLVVQSLRETCRYSGTVWKGVVHKATYDTILDLTWDDKRNISKLISSIEGNSPNSSCYIEG